MRGQINPAVVTLKLPQQIDWRTPPDPWTMPLSADAWLALTEMKNITACGWIWRLPVCTELNAVQDNDPDAGAKQFHSCNLRGSSALVS